MDTHKFLIGNIPAMVWGEKTDKVYIFIHGLGGYKECAERFAQIALLKGYNTLSFDLPDHGERKGGERCDVWTGPRDLTAVAKYAFSHWGKVSLFGFSLGAFFSINTYNDIMFKKVLFQSPVLDMEHLIEKMFRWYDITEERLFKEREISTPLALVTWDYYRYVLEHPTEKWISPTTILLGGRDDLQSVEVVRAFSNKFGCKLTVSESSEHSFTGEGDPETVDKWMRENI